MQRGRASMFMWSCIWINTQQVKIKETASSHLFTPPRESTKNCWPSWTFFSGQHDGQKVSSKGAERKDPEERLLPNIYTGNSSEMEKKKCGRAKRKESVVNRCSSSDSYTRQRKLNVRHVSGCWCQSAHFLSAAVRPHITVFQITNPFSIVPIPLFCQISNSTSVHNVFDMISLKTITSTLHLSIITSNPNLIYYIKVVTLPVRNNIDLQMLCW